MPGTLSRVVPLQKPPRRGNFPGYRASRSATGGPALVARYAGPSGRVAQARAPPAVPGTPGDLGLTPTRSPCLPSITDQRSSGASGSRTEFTRTEVCTLSRLMKQRVQVAMACANSATGVSPTEVTVASGIAERTHLRPTPPTRSRPDLLAGAGADGPARRK